MQAAPVALAGGPPVVVPPVPQQGQQPQQPHLQNLVQHVPVQPNSYREEYGRPVTDPFGGNYTNLYHEYSVGATTPLDLRNAMYRDGNTGAYLNIGPPSCPRSSGPTR